MTEIAIVRAAHLHVYLDELRAIGVPVERELARSRLPSWIEETPDAYVSIPLGLEWLARCSRDIELMDLGFRASRRGTLASLSAPLRRAVLDAPTGFARMRALLRLATLDDSVLATRMQPEGDQVRMICDLEGLGGNPFVCLGEWLSLQAMISIVQSVADPAWRPREMTFVARQRPSAAAREAFPDTRILVSQIHTSMLVESELLVGPGRLARAARQSALLWTTRSPAGATPRRSGRPSGPISPMAPALPRMAEVVGLNRRTLQRRLRQCGRTYSDIVQEARFDLARELPVDPAARVIDVAMAAGYQNPLHFARAFRQLAGVSPTAYRRSAAATGLRPGDVPPSS